MHISDIIKRLIPYITHLGALGYWVASIATILETIPIVGLLVPGSTIVLIFGALSAAGYYDFWQLFMFAVPSAILGDYINYRLGKKYGQSWIKNEKWFLKKSHLEKGKRFFDSYGARSLSIGRLIPGLKETFPFIAGSMNTKQSKFLFWDSLGAIAWGFEFLLAGYIFGSSIHLAKVWLGHLTALVAIVFFLFLILYALKLFFVRYGSEIINFQKSIWNSIKTNPDVKKLTERHPKFFSFLKSRLTTKQFSGLPLTILSLIFLYTIFLFTETILEVTHKGILFKFDLMLANLVYYFRNATMVKVMLFITMFGSKLTVTILTIAITSIFILYRKKRYILPLLVSIIGSTATTWSIKFIMHRPRPLQAYYHAIGFSFPSGHATIAVAFYGFLSFIAVMELKSLKSRFNAILTGLALIILIGASRLYLDVHYFSDVWAGYLIGTIWLVVAIGIYEYLKYQKPVSEINTTKKAKYISYTIAIISLTTCFALAANFNPKPIKQKQQHLIPTNNVLSIFQNNYMKYTTTILGEREEPINLIIIAKNDNELKKDIRLAGWYFAKKLSFESIKKSIIALIYNKPYNRAPVSPDFWDYRVQNFGIEKLIKGDSIRLRHHGRIWKTPYTIEGNKIYVATVSFDTKLNWIIHKISPNIDKEREYFFRSLMSKHLIVKYKKIQFVKPFIGYNFYGNKFFTDGKAYIIWLK